DVGAEGTTRSTLLSPGREEGTCAPDFLAFGTREDLLFAAYECHLRDQSNYFIRPWRLSDGQPKKVIRSSFLERPSAISIKGMAVGSDGYLRVAVLAGNTIELWQVSQERRLSWLGIGESDQDLVWASPDGRLLGLIASEPVAKLSLYEMAFRVGPLRLDEWIETLHDVL